MVNWCQYDGRADPFVVGEMKIVTTSRATRRMGTAPPGGYTYIDRDNDETEPNNVPLVLFQNVCNGIDDFWRKVDYDGGFYEYTQIIKVYDDIDPEVIYTQPDPFCSYDGVECTGLVDCLPD